MLPVVSGMACVVSAYTTQQGLATATSDLLVSAGVALAGGAFLFVFSLFLMWRFPYAEPQPPDRLRRRDRSSCWRWRSGSPRSGA